jgi:hypothetical protein
MTKRDGRVEPGNFSILTDDVTLNRFADTVGCSRAGTVLATRVELVALLGEPHSYEGDKTTMEWYFTTTRGRVSLYDYWWNKPGEWSIGATNEDAAEFLAAAFRKHGFRAAAGAMSQYELEQMEKA